MVGSRSILLISSIFLLSLSSHATATSITSMRTISDAHITKVVLSCPINEPNGVTLYYRRVGANRERVIANTTKSSSRVLLNFDLTPDIEGYYYCEVDNIRSDNEVELVAYPTINPEIRAQTIYSTPTGDHAIIHCPYKPGVLLDNYSVSWFRGLSQVNTLAPAFSRYSILNNFSLVINNTVPDDAKAYACNIAVNISGDVVKKYGLSVSLEVTDPIRITQYITDVAILPGQDAVFTCTAVGVPQPRIKWLIGSKEVTEDGNVIISSTLNSITVQSTLRRTAVTETETGPVSCVAYHSFGGDLFLATSTSNLVILTNNFPVTLTSETNGNVRIRAPLPAVIPGVFSLIVKFIFNTAVVQQREIIHPSFKNTNFIDISIPEPQFRQFGVSIALKFDDIVGKLTPETEKITLPNELPSSITGSDCECPQFPEDSKNSPESTITQVLLGIFLVAVIGLFIVGSVLLGLCVHYMRKKQPLRSLTASPYFHESGSVKGDTLTRSISRSSYNSDTSSSSGRSSRSHNSERSGKSIHSSRSGSSRRSSRSGNSRGTWSQEDLESVREVYAETDSLKHKELAQWGDDHQQEPHSSPVTPDPIKNPYEEIQFQPPTSREEVFHTSLPHATNPIQFTIKYEKKNLRHSGSSFEDLELDNSPHFQPPFQTK